MAWFDIFKPQTFQTCEAKGDGLVDTGDLGLAKLAYEKALTRLEGLSAPEAAGHRHRVEAKLRAATETLARNHMLTAGELLSAGCHAEASELLALARQLTRDPRRLQDLERLKAELAENVPAAAAAVEPLTDSAGFDPHQEEDFFEILTGALPDDVQEAYLSLGENFRSGYLALNQGDFQAAVELLGRAQEEQGGRTTFVDLELATACLNLGDVDRARRLLEAFVASYPESLRAYETLCEIYWEAGEYDRADRLLQSCPETLKVTVPLLLLMGETLLQSGKADAAAAFYQKSIEYLGWNEPVAVALARTYEALAQNDRALATYRDVLDGCRSCHARVDPFVRERYAELSYEAGDISSHLLETYLTLCQENPDRKDLFFERVGDIYRRQGHHAEGRRYLEMARQTRGR